MESREDIVKRIGRSPDKGTALLLCVMSPDPREVWSRLCGQQIEVAQGEAQQPSPFGPVAEEMARFRELRRQKQQAQGPGVRRIR